MARLTISFKAYQSLYTNFSLTLLKWHLQAHNTSVVDLQVLALAINLWTWRIFLLWKVALQVQWPWLLLFSDEWISGHWRVKTEERSRCPAGKFLKLALHHCKPNVRKVVYETRKKIRLQNPTSLAWTCIVLNFAKKYNFFSTSSHVMYYEPSVASNNVSVVIFARGVLWEI